MPHEQKHLSNELKLKLNMYTLGCCAGSLGFQQLNMKASWRPLLLDWDGLEPYTHLQKKPPTITGPIVITLLLNMNGKKNKVVWLTVPKHISCHSKITTSSSWLLIHTIAQGTELFRKEFPHLCLAQQFQVQLVSVGDGVQYHHILVWSPKPNRFYETHMIHIYIYNWLLLISLGCSLAV